MSVFAMSGHVDHGKSTFLKYLTQKEPDRLKEEKKRGMTIDLNFVWFEINQKDIGIIDVPGHKDYLKNMIAGVFGVDAFIFIVAADDGWMPQSEEHLNILKGLRIKKGIAVITKTDLVSKERVCEVKEFVKQKIGLNSVFEFNPHQLELLKPIAQELEKMSTSKSPDTFSKVSIDRVFSPKGLGAVITGTLSSGRIAVGDTLTLYPDKTEVSVKKIQTYHKEKQEVSSTERVAIQLSKVSSRDLYRGQFLSSNKDIALTKAIEAQVDLNIELKKNIEAWFYVGTAKKKCYVIPYKENPRFFRVKFEESIALLPLEPFILRNSGDDKTIGFGTVVDTQLVSSKHAVSLKALKNWQPTLKGYLKFKEGLEPEKVIVPDTKEAEEHAYLNEKEKFLASYKSNFEPFKLQKNALVQKMILKKDLIYLSEEHYLSREAYEVLSNKVKNYIHSKGQASTSELREHMGLSRKYVVMILESLDRNRLTYLKEGVRKLLKTFVLLAFLSLGAFAHKKDCGEELIDYSEQAILQKLCQHEVLSEEIKASLFFIYHKADQLQRIPKMHWDRVSYLSILEGTREIRIHKNTVDLKSNIHKILVAHDYKLASQTAQKHFSRFFNKVSQLELIQEALSFGYKSALEAYRPEVATSETSYTITWFIHAMRRYLEIYGNLVYIPIGQQEDRVLWNRAKKILKNQLQRDATDDEIYETFIWLRVTSIQNHRLKRGVVQSYDEIFSKLSKRHRNREILISNMREVSRGVIRDGAKEGAFKLRNRLAEAKEDFEENEIVEEIFSDEKVNFLRDIELKVVKYKLGLFRLNEFSERQIKKFEIVDREPISNVRIAKILGLNPVQVKWLYAKALQKLRRAFIRK